jgi:polyhydroxyalkanoate synthesis repressor PhaR
MAAASTRSAGTKIVRRYGNRKLYDTENGRYVTLEELSAVVSSGQDVAVVDQKTGEDITSLTLAQVLVEAVKSRKERIPRQVLTRLIRLAAGPDTGWSSWPEPHEAAVRAREEAEKIVTALIGRGRLTLDEAVSLRQDLGQMVHRLVGEAQSGVESRLRALVERGEDVAGRSFEALRGGLSATLSYLDKPRPSNGRRRSGKNDPGRAKKK